MVAKIRSLGLQGIGGYEVSAEIFLSGGLPQFDLVGLPDAAVKEARERVRASVQNCGLDFPVSRVTVNLAPADRKKAGTVYDLPILLGILIASGKGDKRVETGRRPVRRRGVVCHYLSLGFLSQYPCQLVNAKRLEEAIVEPGL